MTRIANFDSILACISITCKRVELSLHEHVTTVEFTKILSQYLAFTSKKINLKELKESPNYRFDLVQARMIETLSVSCACGACARKCFALAFMSGLRVNSNSFRI